MAEARPLISIITPVGPRHTRHVAVARASLDWQTVPRAWWEHIAIHDTAREGPAVCRNRGLERARGVFTIFLDSDDYLLPGALATYLRAYAVGDAGYVYGDAYTMDGAGHVRVDADGRPQIVSAHEYQRASDTDPLTGWQRPGLDRINLHVVTALVPTAAARAVGGFDEGIDAWEDWAYWIRLAQAGVCGARVPCPTLVYRIGEGDRMQRFVADPAANAARMEAVLARYRGADGRIPMACCGGANQDAQAHARAAVRLLGEGEMPEGLIRYQYIGGQAGSFTLRSPHTGATYKLARGRLVDVAPEDAAWLESFGTVRRVEPAPFVPPPEASAAIDGAPDVAAVADPAPKKRAAKQ